MTLKIIVAVIAIAATPLCAHAQNAPKPQQAQPAQPAAKKATNADAQKVVQIISADKAKTKTYCDIAKLGEQIEAADQKKDTKKVEALSMQADDMGQKLGPEYVALMDGLLEVDQNSKDGKDIATTMSALDKLCK